MPHLTLEALARLVDEAPGPEERRHLEACRSCAMELGALREQTEALATLPKMVPPPDAWPVLRARLAEEGLLAERPRRWLTPTVTRAAAAVTLFVAGSATGWALRGAPQAEPAAPGLATESAPAMGVPGTGASLALDPGTPPEAATEMEAAEARFAAALDRYMMTHSSEAPDPAARLAALDNIVLTTAEALNESPADPVINGYHLTAVAQRNELLRQIAAAAGDPVF